MPTTPLPLAQTLFPPETAVAAEVDGEDIVLQGSFQGQVRAQRIRVDASAVVNAALTCDVAEILGRFEGTIHSKALRFGPEAVVRGVFVVDRLTMAEGAIVDGAFNVDAPPRNASVAGALNERDAPGKGVREGMEALAPATVLALEPTPA